MKGKIVVCVDLFIWKPFGIFLLLNKLYPLQKKQTGGNNEKYTLETLHKDIMHDNTYVTHCLFVHTYIQNQGIISKHINAHILLPHPFECYSATLAQLGDEFKI